jgi:hypothetical protein
VWDIVNDGIQMTEREAKEVYSGFKFYFLIKEFGVVEDDNVGNVYAIADSEISWKDLRGVVQGIDLSKNDGLVTMSWAMGNDYLNRIKQSRLL